MRYERCEICAYVVRHEFLSILYIAWLRRRS